MAQLDDRRLPRAFWDRVELTAEGCWRWTGAIDTGGYGMVSWGPYPWGTARAHRVAYLAFVGPIERGLVLDHLCHSTAVTRGECMGSSCEHRQCVNPDHLEVVSIRTNNLRGMSWAAQNARATHCVRGHSLEGANLYVTPSGRRQCRTCGNLRSAKARKR